jgi:hypothetical protein
MARLYEPSQEELLDYKNWVSSRPAHVKAIAERFDPWSLYKLKSTGQYVTVYSFNKHEDGSITLKVNMPPEFNPFSLGYLVFGISPEDLEPCEIPEVYEFPKIHIIFP